jgi:hypothetical protein
MRIVRLGQLSKSLSSTGVLKQLVESVRERRAATRDSYSYRGHDSGVGQAQECSLPWLGQRGVDLRGCHDAKLIAHELSEGAWRLARGRRRDGERHAGRRINRLISATSEYEREAG